MKLHNRNFKQMLKAQWARGNFVCVGLDSKFSNIPKSAHRSGNGYGVSVCNTIVEFNRAIVEETKDSACSYKLNIAFYLPRGTNGVQALERTIGNIHIVAPDVPVILDTKFADIGNTNAGYVDFAFGLLQVDAITVHPYLGAEALQSFLSQVDKGIIVLCRTSNPGAGEFQDLLVNGKPLYQIVAHNVENIWNKNDNCMLVVGATYPDELRAVRKIVGDMPILIPGIGAQGGDVEKTVNAGKDSHGQGMIINSSRGIIFASSDQDFAQVARRKTIELNDLINKSLPTIRKDKDAPLYTLDQYTTDACE